MGKEFLLSIIVPTKNRPQTLESFIELVCSFQNDDVELVVQDNSDTNEEILSFLEQPAYCGVSYFYDPTPMSMNQNSELAIRHSRGKYVCFMGDDDLLSEKLYGFVRWMDGQGYESAVFHKASYSWPGVEYKVHQFANLIIPRFSGNVAVVDVAREYSRLLSIGGLGMGKLPQLYHGVVSRVCLDAVYEKAGTYFPGPSSDMAVSVALAQVVKRHLYCDAPLISSGVSPKSAAGLGAKHQHKGDLKGKSFLPANVDEVWEKKLPKIWTGPTIWAESAIKAMRTMGAKDDLERFNYSYFCAWFYIFCPDYRDMLTPLKTRENGFCPVAYYRYLVSIFLLRCRRFLYNLIENKFHLFETHIDNIPTSYIAQQEIDRIISKLDKEWMLK